MHIEDFMKFCEKKQGSELCFSFGFEHIIAMNFNYNTRFIYEPFSARSANLP